MVRFLPVARGSAGELEYHLLLARDLSLLCASCYRGLNGKVNDIQRTLIALTHRIEKAVNS
jgi:four helix bundle protein